MGSAQPASGLVLVGSAALAWAMASLRNKRSKEETDVNSPQEEANNLPHQLLPRFFLLQSLQDQMDELPGLFGASKWSQFYQELNRILREIHKSIFSLIDTSRKLTALKLEGEGSVEQVTDVIDKELVVTLIQRQAGLAELLRDDAPSSTQTWAAFVAPKLTSEEERSFANEELVNPDFQKELLNCCMHIVERLISELRALHEFIGLTDKRSSRQEIQADFVDAKRISTTPETCYKVVKIFYATDRQVTVDGDYIGALRLPKTKSGETGPVRPLLHYGMMEVGIPQEHELGKLEAPRGVHEEADPVKHVVILSVDTKLRSDQSGFMNRINANIEECRTSFQGQDHSLEILVFIHGYRCNLKKAVKRAAQLKEDLQFQGTVIAYSWSSKGTPLGYLHDQTTVAETVPYLSEFLSTITRQAHGKRVHVLAHSMGNRALVGALTQHYNNWALSEPPAKSIPSEISQLNTSDPGEASTSSSGAYGSAGPPIRPPPICPLSQVIFAAADEEFEKFRKLVEIMVQSKPSAQEHPGPNITVYCSTDDFALGTSFGLHGNHRLGSTRSHLKGWQDADELGEMVDIVDATGVGFSNFRHSYFCDVGVVLMDLRRALNQERAAKRGFTERMTTSGRKSALRIYEFVKDKPACIPIY